MTKALSSAVEIKLDGDTFNLVPSLKAATAVSRHFEGFLGAYQALGNMNLDAYAFICRQGINRNTISTDDLNNAIYRTGIPKLVAPLNRYVTLLQNGGRDPDDVEDGFDADEDEDAGNEGNGES